MKFLDRSTGVNEKEHIANDIAKVSSLVLVKSVYMFFNFGLFCTIEIANDLGF
jgi:hypothetical protein